MSHKPQRRRLVRPVSWVGPIVVSLVLGAVAWTVTEQAPASGVGGFSQTNSRALPGMASSTVSSSSTKLFLSFRQPKSDRDRRVELDLVSGIMTDIPETQGWRVSAPVQAAITLKIETTDRGSRLTDGGEWNVPLRSTSGDAYQDPVLLGLLNDTNAVITARNGKNFILNISRSGAMTKLADLPENAQVLGLSGGSVWYATFVQGEGIESDPQGPSSLFRVAPDGRTTAVTEDPNHVFVGAWSDGSVTVAWTEMPGGRAQLWLMNGGGRVELPAPPAVVSLASYDMD